MRAYILGAREGNIGNAIADELCIQGCEVARTDCMIGDGSRPPGGNMDRETALGQGYVETDKGHYARYDAPSVLEFNQFDADALIISLGSTYKDPFWEVKERDIERVIRACLTLPLIAARRYVQAVEAIRYDGMIELGSDPRQIVFIGSYAHNHPFTNGTVYCAAKAGLDMAVRTLGWELTDRGYRLFIVHPWHVKGTPMWQEVEQGVMKSKGWTKEKADAYADRDLKMPEGLKPEEVAEIVRTVLMEPSMGWLSGSAIELNGGTR